MITVGAGAPPGAPGDGRVVLGGGCVVLGGGCVVLGGGWVAVDVVGGGEGTDRAPPPHAATRTTTAAMGTSAGIVERPRLMRAGGRCDERVTARQHANRHFMCHRPLGGTFAMPRRARTPRTYAVGRTTPAAFEAMEAHHIPGRLGVLPAAYAKSRP